MSSSLKARLGPRVQVRDAGRVASGSPARLCIAVSGADANTPGAAVALARRHLPLARAHRLLTEALETGRGQFVEVPCVESPEALLEELRACGLTAEMAEGEVDVLAVRAATGLTQERFALEYGLDPATLRNWEQGRTRPDLTARSYLRLIAEDPAGVRDRRARVALGAQGL